MAAIILMAAMVAWAIGTQRVSYVVTHGISMLPVYHAGDLVIVAKSDSYEVGQIAAYHGSGGRLEVLHRIIGGDDNGYVLKGDNNGSIDAETPASKEIIGRAVVHIPKAGAWLQPLLSPTGLGMLGFLFVGGGTAAAKTRRDIPRGSRKKKVKRMSGQGGTLAMATASFKAIRRLHPAAKALAIMVGLCGFAGIALGLLGWIKPATEAVVGTARAGESMTYSYSAEVPRSAAYDGTTVYSPDPIFRKLTEIVDLHMHYRGRPGRIGVTARLSADNGWHTTMQLSQEKEFNADRYTGKVQLDLAALQQRAVDAGKAIGAEIGAVTLAITAQVQHSDGTTFEPQVSLNLAPLQLTLAGGPETLVLDQSSGGTVASMQNRQIGVFGYDLLTAHAARRYAVYLLLIAFVGAMIIAVMALRHVPLRTRAQIERRYPHLIVPVEPMASPPGKPVVQVDTFPALVKLAERYGQMILTWTRPDGSDDFVVRDEGITYRYRILTAATDPESPQITADPAATSRSRKAAPVSGSVPAAALPAAPEAPEIAVIEPATTPEAATVEIRASETAAARKPSVRATAAVRQASAATSDEQGSAPTMGQEEGGQQDAGEQPQDGSKKPKPRAKATPAKAPAKRARRPRPKPTAEPAAVEPPALEPEPAESATTEPATIEPSATESTTEPQDTERPVVEPQQIAPEAADLPIAADTDQLQPDTASASTEPTEPATTTPEPEQNGSTATPAEPEPAAPTPEQTTGAAADPMAVPQAAETADAEPEQAIDLADTDQSAGKHRASAQETSQAQELPQPTSAKSDDAEKIDAEAKSRAEGKYNTEEQAAHNAPSEVKKRASRRKPRPRKAATPPQPAQAEPQTQPQPKAEAQPEPRPNRSTPASTETPKPNPKPPWAPPTGQRRRSPCNGCRRRAPSRAGSGRTQRAHRDRPGRRG